MKGCYARVFLCSMIYFTLQCDALVINVTNNSDSGGGSLREAINTANTNAGSTINFNMGIGKITLTSPLPPISANGTQIIGPMTPQEIEGSTSSSTAVFFVLEGVTGVGIQNLTIENVTALGGHGGDGSTAAGGGGLGAGAGLLVANGAVVDIANVTFTNNKAQGGDGGKHKTFALDKAGAAGGGGFRGAGGESTSQNCQGAGGGGGFEGAGGEAKTRDDCGGGGGGGQFFDGATVSETPGGGGGGQTGDGTAEGSGCTLGSGSSKAGTGGTSAGGGGGGSGAAGGAGEHGNCGGDSGGSVDSFPGADSPSATNDDGGPGANGGNGGYGGGGGGGGAGGTPKPGGKFGIGGAGGNGGYGGGGGGAGGQNPNNTAEGLESSGNGGNGGKWGGGGGSTISSGGSGGFGAGGGGGNNSAFGGNGGFGGGGGGGGGNPFVTSGPGIGGFGAGNGGFDKTEGTGGGGGAGLGGAIFVDVSGTLNITDCVFSGNSTVGGEGGKGSTGGGSHTDGTSGHGMGDDLFLISGTTTTFASTGSMVIPHPIMSDLNAAGGGFLGGVVINGSGSVSFPDGNTYTGGTTINGTLIVSSDTVTAGTGGGLGYYDPANNFPGNVTFGGGTLNTTNTMAPDYFTTARTIILNGGGNFQPVISSSATYQGVIQGVGPLTISGGGVVYPTAQNTYTGGTIVTGAVSISSDGNLGAAAGGVSMGPGSFLITTADVTLNASRTFTLNTSFCNIWVGSGLNSTIAGPITGTGILFKDQPGNLNLSGANNYMGGTIVNGGSLTVNSMSLPAMNGTQLSGTLIFDQGFSGTYGGAISDYLMGTGIVIKQGAGTLTLTQTNPYSGGTTIAEGGISIGSAANLGTGGIAFTGNSSLLLTGVVNANQPVTINTGVTATIGDGGVANTSTFSGLLSGGGVLNLNMSALGQLVLANPMANTYSGGTLLNSGILSISQGNNLGTGPLTFTGNSTLLLTMPLTSPATAQISINGGITGTVDDGGNASFIDGVIQDGTPSGGAFQKLGSGVMTLTAQSTYQGNTTIGAGTLALLGSGGISSTSEVAIASGATFDISQITASSYSGKHITGTGTVALGNKNLTANILGSSTFDGLITDAAISGLTGGTLTVNAPGSGSVGTLTLTNPANAYTGGTMIGGGILSISSQGNIGTGPVSFIGNSTLQFSAAINPFSLPLSINSGVQGTIDDSGFNSEISSIITGLGSFRKIGSGTLTLSANNVYSGGTLVENGDLLGIGTAGVMPLQGEINITNALSTVIFDQTGTNTFSGAIRGVGSIVKQNTGTLNWAGTSSHAGSTTINGGTLALVGSGQISSVSLLQINSGIFDLSGYTANTFYRAGDIAGASGTQIILGSINLIMGRSLSTAFDGNISGSGSLTKQGSGTLTLSGMNTYGGGTIINAGALAITTLASLPTGTNLTINNGSLLDATAIPASSTLLIGNFAGNGGQINLSNTTILETTATQSTTFRSVGSGLNGMGVALVKQGSETLRLLGVNTYTGGTTINAGTLSIFQDESLGAVAGNLDFDGGILSVEDAFATTRVFQMLSGGGTVKVSLAPSVMTLNSGLIGSGSFTKTGLGTLVLAASNGSYTGDVTVDQGALIVSSDLPVALTVNSSGLLGGVGTIGNSLTTLLNHGTISPGNSIGTLNIIGDYTQSSTGHHLVEINDQGASDLLAITGAATLDGSIDVIPMRGAYFANSGIVYEVVNAVGGRTGEFASFNILDPGGILKLQIIYNPTQVLLTALNNRFFVQPVIKEHNPRHVGVYLESLQYYQDNAPIPAQEDLISVIQNLVQLSDNQLIAALDQLHPAQFGEFGLVTNDIRSEIASLIHSHPKKECCNHLLELIRCDNASLWLETFGMHTHQKPRSHQRGFTSETGGLMLGGDYAFSNGILIGAAAGGDTTYLKWSGGMGHAHIPSVFMSLFADWSHKRGFIETSVMGGYDFFRTERHIHFTGENRKAKSKHGGYDLSAHLGGGFDIRTGAFFVEPFFNFDYSNLHQNGFSEHGADSLDLKVEEKDFGFLRAEEGVSLTRSYKTRRGCFSPRVWMSFVTSMPLYGKNYKSAMQGQTKSFTVWTYHRTVNRFSPGIELIWSVNSSVSLAARYGAEIGKDIVEQKADFRFEWDF